MAEPESERTTAFVLWPAAVAVPAALVAGPSKAHTAGVTRSPDGGAMRNILVFLAAAAIAAVFVSTATADRAYHTEYLPLSGVAGAPGGGAVVNIHTNGLQVYAHEIYTLRHAVPGTYQVSLNVFPTSLACTGATFAVPTATISTNAIGNGLAD